MFQEKINTKEIFTSYDNSVSELLQLLSSLSEKQINTIPFIHSWNAGQLTEHVTKSNWGISNALNLEGIQADRKPDERVLELKEMFLDFTIKFQSSEFILPTKDFYYKEITMEEMGKSIEHLKEVCSKVNLSESIKHPAFGEITKLELLYFVDFHMQRHLRQLKKIVQMVKNK